MIINDNREGMSQQQQHPSSIISDESEEDDLYYESFADKCAICFTEEASLHMSHCLDQLCLGCLEKYLVITMKEKAWGFGSVDLDCPICHWPLLIEDWYPWVGEEVIRLYEESRHRANQLGRFCKSCGHKQLFYNEDELLSDCEDLLESIGIEYASGPRTNLTKWQDMKSCQSDMTEKNVDLITRTLVQDFVDLFKDDYGEEHSGETIALRKLLRYELKYTCEKCKSPTCMRCGENHWHLTKSCGDYLKSLTDDADIQWKIQNCKNCPNCWTFVEKEPEGCNEMQCALCGCKFCWECLEVWSNKCGVYECRKSRNTSWERPTKRLKSPVMRNVEAGVPDVEKVLEELKHQRNNS